MEVLQMGRIFLLRHGQTTANAQHVIQGPRIDAELSELGLRQADSLARALAAQPLAQVFSSPLRRARQTAQAVVTPHQHGHAHLAVQVVPELYEMDYGRFVGRTVAEVKDEMDQVLDAWRMGFPETPFPGGESALVAQMRVRPFVQRVLQDARRQDVAVVAHGRINRVLLATLTGAGLTRLEDFPQANANITELDVHEATTLRRLNDTGHLDLASDSFS